MAHIMPQVEVGDSSHSRGVSNGLMLSACDTTQKTDSKYGQDPGKF
jgi:hypothetical protein